MDTKRRALLRFARIAIKAAPTVTLREFCEADRQSRAMDADELEAVEESDAVWCRVDGRSLRWDRAPGGWSCGDAFVESASLVDLIPTEHRGLDHALRRSPERLNRRDVELLSDAFGVPAVYWSPSLADALVVQIAERAPIKRKAYRGEVTTGLLLRLLWLHRIARGEGRTMLQFLRDTLDSDRKTAARSLVASLERGSPNMATMTTAAQAFGVSPAYWLLDNYNDARAVAAGAKTIGVTDRGRAKGQE